MDESEHSRTLAEEDAVTEAALLYRILDIYPGQATVAELLREMTGPLSDFGERDAIDRAVRELTGAGLLHRHGEFLLPSRAALRFSELNL